MLSQYPPNLGGRHKGSLSAGLRPSLGSIASPIVHRPLAIDGAQRSPQIWAYPTWFSRAVSQAVRAQGEPFRNRTREGARPVSRSSRRRQLRRGALAARGPSGSDQGAFRPCGHRAHRGCRTPDRSAGSEAGPRSYVRTHREGA